MDARIGFITDYNSGLVAMTELCKRYEISRKTGFKWLERYRDLGAAGLTDRSRAPHEHGRATPQNIAEAIVGIGHVRPSWGPRKIVAKLAMDHPEIDWPAASTAGEILKRAGLVCGRRLRRSAPPRIDPLTVPRACQSCVGGRPQGLGSASRWNTGGTFDDHGGFSRYSINVAATVETTQDEARPLFERAFRDHGLPEVIRSDTGTPFASTGTTGLTALSAWWIKLGIKHERIDPGHPRQNGRHERFHRTVLEAMQPPAADRRAQARRFEAFAYDYNEERPHEALGQRTPASLYRPSLRAMPRKLPEPSYPAETAVRQVRSSGEIKWQGVRSMFAARSRAKPSTWTRAMTAPGRSASSTSRLGS